MAGLDAAAELLRIARSRVPGADLHVGDLEELPFPDNAFDLVTGFNSFQYAAHPVIALSEARRITRPDGLVVVMTWGPPDGMEAASLVSALKPLLPPPGAPGPFSLSDADALKALATSADRAHAQALAAFRQADGSYRLRASFRWLAARK